MNAYVSRVMAGLEARNAHEKEFLQAAKEVLETLSPVFDKHPEYEKKGLLDRFVEPDRIIMFRVAWLDDKGQTQVNRGYRVQYNNAIGPYKGKIEPSCDITEAVQGADAPRSPTGTPAGSGSTGFLFANFF